MSKFVLTAVAFAIFSAPLRAEVTRGPYLQQLTATSVLVAWQSSSAVKGVLHINQDGLTRVIQEERSSTEHTIRIRNLTANTRYAYQIIEHGTVQSSSQFRTSRGSCDQTPISIAAVGDSGTGSAVQYQIATRISAVAPRLMLLLGDNVYPLGADSDYDANFFGPYGKILRERPIYPVIGNHDVFNVEVYQQIFTLPGESARGTDRYYSFNIGSAHFVALDTNLAFDDSSAQQQWLRRDLARVRRSCTPWVIAFFHHPPFSSGEHGDTIAVQQYLTPIFEQYRVNLVLSGHDHDYERMERINLSGRGGSPVYIVSGGGGNEDLYSNENPNSHSKVFQSVHHFLLIRSSGTRLTLRAIAADGTAIDRFTLRRSR